jgi:hypothetical protein
LNNQTDTELTEKLSKRLIAGTYSLKAVYAGEHRSAFEPVEKSIQLKAGDMVNLPFAFQPRMHSLILSANVTDYTLHILDKETGKSTVYKDSGQIPPLYAGAYTIRVVKPGYRIVDQEIDIIDKDISLKYSLIELDKLYNDRIQWWKGNKYLSETIFLAALGVSAYYGYSFQQNYRKYQNADSVNSADASRKKTTLSRSIASIAISIDILSGPWFLYSYSKHQKWQKQMQIEMGGIE